MVDGLDFTCIKLFIIYFDYELQFSKPNDGHELNYLRIDRINVLIYSTSFTFPMNLYLSTT